MDYSLEELYPVFERLSWRYMGADTSSIPYEKAQSLMNAVIYCISHYEETQGEAGERGEPTEFGAASGCHSLHMTHKAVSAKGAYSAGLEAVREKTCRALSIYTEIMRDFDSFGCLAYEDTVLKGMPEFFKWYDPEFDPENHMLMFDYPVMTHIESLSGIDAIYTYLECVRIEQGFLHSFPADAVTDFLHIHNSNYTQMFENICRLVARRAVLCMLAGCEVAKLRITQSDFDFLRNRLEGCERLELQQLFEKAVDTLIDQCYGADQALLLYLRPDMAEFAFEFLSACDNNYLCRLVPCN